MGPTTVTMFCLLFGGGFCFGFFVGLREKIGEKRKKPRKNQRKSLGKLDCSFFLVWIYFYRGGVLILIPTKQTHVCEYFYRKPYIPHHFRKILSP